MSNAMNRRSFLKTSGAAVGAAAAASLLPATSRAAVLDAASTRRVVGANERLRVAFIGTGGIAPGQAIGAMLPFNIDCPCFADVNTQQWGNAAKHWAGAKGFQDYRKMYDAHMKDIDAVMVSTPDHHHYPATLLAMMAGKHVYTQKPLTHTVWEAGQLRLAMDKYKVATQMGCQNHANEGNRRLVEWVRSGKIGKIKEVKAWTNRPNVYWVQGQPRPQGSTPIPQNLDWESWIGPAPMRPYVQGDHGIWHSTYTPGSWRGFRDFGTGALGDMGCHTLDGPFWAMGLDAFKGAELIEGEPVRGKDMWPTGSVVKLTFPGNDFVVDGLSITWYEGGKKPTAPVGHDKPLGPSGTIFYGEKGTLVTAGDYAEQTFLVGDPTGFQPEKTLARSEGHHKEWYLACTGQKAYTYPRANFSFAAPFTQTILAATIAQVVGGKLEYDAKALKFTGNAEATALLTKTYRKGWEFKM